MQHAQDVHSLFAEKGVLDRIQGFLLVKCENFHVFYGEALLCWDGVAVLLFEVIVAEIPHQPLTQEPHGYDLILLLEGIHHGPLLICRNPLIDYLLLIIHCVRQ